MLSVESILAANDRIKIHIHKTPVFTSEYFNSISGRKLFFKAESLQKTGSFKVRGAMNALSVLLAANSVEVKRSGVITHSSGNHGQALAFAAKKLSIPCKVVAPSSTSQVKVDAMESYGATIVFCEDTMASRVETCQRIIDETAAFLVHAHNDYNVMSGQGTVALEFLDQCPDLEAILVSVGGGGLLSGVSCYTKTKSPKCKVFCVEPMGKNLQKSLEAGKDLDEDFVTVVPTVADGIRVRHLGDNNFAEVLKYCEKQVFTVNEDDIIRTMRAIFQRMKLVVEPSASICLAAALSEKFKQLPADIKNVGIVLCGGNVDVDHLPWF